MIPLELLARIAAAALIFALIALWEVLAPRRPWSVGRRGRWPHNLGIVVIDALAVRILIPTAAVGAALLAAGNGWGLFHVLGLRLSVASLFGFLALDLAIYAQPDAVFERTLLESHGVDVRTRRADAGKHDRLQFAELVHLRLDLWELLARGVGQPWAHGIVIGLTGR